MDLSVAQRKVPRLILQLRSSGVQVLKRDEGFDLRAEARATQPSSVTLHEHNLQREEDLTATDLTPLQHTNYTALSLFLKLNTEDMYI